MESAFVADTNLFFECRRLEELPWSELAVDPIVVALTKPVLSEIDKHKKSGGRTRKRAIEISRRIREMLSTMSPEVVIKEAEPRVTLRLVAMVQPDPEFAGALDYAINDDRIVGTASAIRKTGTFSSVSVLTDDSVAASTAHGIGLPFFLIPESWKRPPEETTEDKRIRELEKDLSTYRAQEPSIKVADVSEHPAQAHVIRRVASKLQPVEIDQLIEKLKERHPVKQDFSVPGGETLPDGTEISYEAAGDDAIEKYTNEYLKWLDACRSIFETLHDGRVEIEADVALAFGVQNIGTRPASNMRVTFEAVGEILLSREKYDLDDDVYDGDDVEGNDIDNVIEGSALKPIPKLPAPPASPAARKIVKRPPPATTGFDIATLKGPAASVRLADFAKASLAIRGLDSHLSAIRSAESMLGSLHGNRALADLARGINPLSDALKQFEERNRINSLINPMGVARSPLYDLAKIQPIYMPKPHDPELFYFDEWPKATTVKRGALSCDLFRHHRAEEVFEIDIVFPKEGKATGAVKCTVEAENLTKPVELVVPVSRKIETYSLSTIAKAMVEACYG
ncbi:PIN domain-containing protein [Neorhizobium sp. T6_25]|uniref:PIN domain-containing protein n=1 Tax=Neorhizobium sp. T6_25 TaxID=2093833 RepID=UPI000CF8D6FE|nr:PIN domain-containing protein [Neorhizobium sp. T6_25]